MAADPRPRILFIDDEEQLLEGLRSALHRQRRAWEMHFAVGGEKALEALANAPFDVIVSDMRMPGIDGATLLHRIREEHPTGIRIALTGHADDRLSMRAIPVAQQWLMKPCERERLVAAIERALDMRALVRDPRVMELAGAAGALPSAPSLYARIRAATADLECSLEDVAKVLECDPAMSARLLQLANSAYFALPREVKRVADAVTLLGLDTISQLVLAEEIFVCLRPEDEVAGFEVATLQAHSRLCARIAARIAPETGGRVAPEDAFTAGILHDVGLLLLADRAPEWLEAVAARAERELKPLAEVEREMGGITHDVAGGYLLASWGLPVSLTLAVARHHAPGPGTELDLAAVTHVASALASELEARRRGTGAASPLDRELLARVGAEARVDAWREIARLESTAFDREG